VSALERLDQARRRRAWKLRAVVIEPAPHVRVVRLELGLPNGRSFGAPPGLSIDDQAEYLIRRLVGTVAR
jgi:hypothetical protein